MRWLILRALALLGLGAKAPSVIRILSPTYNPQMLYNHAMLYKGWHHLLPLDSNLPIPPGFSELVRRVLVQRALIHGSESSYDSPETPPEARGRS